MTLSQFERVFDRLTPAFLLFLGFTAAAATVALGA